MKLVFDKYGEAILDSIEHGKGNLVVNAVAGAGKTTIIVEAAKRLPRNTKILIVAFNKSIEDELVEKINRNHLNNVTVMTYHALGKRIVEENNSINIPEVNGNKYRTYLMGYLNERGTHTFSTMGKIRYFSYYNNIMLLVDYSRFALAHSIDDIKEVALRYGIKIMDDECETALEILHWGKCHLAQIDFADMIWLPLELNYETEAKYDFIFIDEAQDTSPAQQYLVRKTFKDNARFVACGDENQTINSWCGADKAAFNSFLKIPDTHSLPLPVSRRCAKEIVKMAQRIVPEIEALPDAPDGYVGYNVLPSEPQSGDMVLCRNTAPLAKLYSYYLSINKKSYIQGGDMDKELLDLLDKSDKEMLNVTLEKDGVFADLYRVLFSKIEDLRKKDKLTERDAIFSDEIDRMYNDIYSLEILSAGVKTKRELLEKFKVIFSSDNGDGVKLSTIHKAKGLEADNVYILGKSLIPSRLAKQPWELKAEKDLEYVAYTRARRNLYFISEKEFPVDDAFSHPESHINKLREIEETVNALTIIDSKDEEIITTSATTKHKTSKKVGGLKYGKFM